MAVYTQALRPVTLITCTVAVAVAAYLLRSRQKRYKKPPYPWTRLPIFGNIFSLLLSKEYAYINFYKTSKKPKYAKVFMIQIGGWDICILNHIDVVREALLMKPTDFAGRPNTFSGELITENKDIIFATYGPEWRFQKKVAHQAIRKFASGAVLEKHLHETVTIAMSAIQKQGDQPFVIRPFLELLVINIFSSILFGKAYAYEDGEFTKFADMTAKGLEVFGSRLPANIFPWMKRFPFQGRGVKKRLQPIFDILDSHLQEHKKSFDPERPRDIVDYMLLTQLEAEEAENEMRGVLTDKRVILTLFDLFGAGIDTTTQILQCIVGRAAMHSVEQDRMQAELDSVLGGRLPLLSDRHQLPYTEAFLQEVQRLDTGAVLGLPFSTTCDTTISDYDLPKDTMMMVNFWALHHDSDIWEEPFEFNPDRFLDTNGQLSPRPESFLPFSAGKRVCLGDSLAKSQLMMILPMVVQKFKFIASENFTFEMEKTGMVNLPKPYEICVQSRI